jgi:hypothetical protein
MPSIFQHSVSASLGWTIAPVSRLKTLPPPPGVGFWRGGCPESKSHWDKEGPWGFRSKNFKFQLLIYNVVSILTDNNTAATSQNAVNQWRAATELCFAKLPINIDWGKIRDFNLWATRAHAHTHTGLRAHTNTHIHKYICTLYVHHHCYVHHTSFHIRDTYILYFFYFLFFIFCIFFFLFYNNSK